MKHPLLRIDIASVNNNTFAKLEYLEEMERVLADSEKEERLKKLYCKVCFYISRMTYSRLPECKNCEKQVNGELNELCMECAKKLKLCQMCSADLNYKTRRVLGNEGK